MNICIVGAGSIGGWIAAKLALSGSNVRALTSRGVLDGIEMVDCGAVHQVRFTPFQGSADVLVLAIKANALEAAAETAIAMIDEKTLIVPMLNGVPWWFIEGQTIHSVDPRGTIAKCLPFDQIIGCVVHASCYRDKQMRVIVNHADKLILGDPSGGRSSRVEGLCSLFSSAGIRSEASDHVRRAIWYKLWGNATINPLSALTRASCDRILEDPECRAWMLEGMSELARIGAAVGCPIGESGEERMAVTARLGAFKTSMLQDVENARPIELEALLGAPREIARRNGIETPALNRLYAVTRMMAQSLALA